MTISISSLLSLVILVLLAAVKPSEAFFGSKAPKALVTSPLTQEALDIYNKAFPFDRPPPKTNPWNDFGMPYTDIDGSRVRSKNPSKRRLTDISRERAAKAFNTLVKLYGEDRAMSIVKAQPLSLCFDSDYFGPSLEAWTEVFGLEAAQDMVARNPGLLAVRPDEAAKSTDSTMVFSYIVGATRPLGPLLLLTLLGLLLTPAIEAATGIQYGINH